MDHSSTRCVSALSSSALQPDHFSPIASASEKQGFTLLPLVWFWKTLTVDPGDLVVSNVRAILKQKTDWRGAASVNRDPGLLAVFLVWIGVVHSLFGQGRTSIVTTLEDGGPGSLRDEIATGRPGDTISFAVQGTIILTNGELMVASNLRIAGPGATNLAISARGQSRVLEILPGAQVTVSGLTICDGRAPDGAAGTSNSPAGGDGSDGGGIYNGGSLTISQCVISNCAAGNGGPGYVTRAYSDPDATNWVGGAAGRGGAVFNSGRLQMIASSLISNSSGAGGDAGGAGQYGAPGTVGGSGGAIYNQGNLALAGCVLEQNTAGHGGAGYSLVFSSSSFDGGHAGGAGGNGGAICDVGQRTTSMTDCRFSFNTSGSGAMGNAPFSHPAVGGAGGAGGGGGAIWNSNSMWVRECTFVSNQSGAGAHGGNGNIDGGAGGLGGPGGAICAMSELNMTSCVCISNHTGSGGDGGSGYSRTGGSGASGGSGGAIFSASGLELNDCHLSSNWTGGGGDGANAPQWYTHPSGIVNGGLGGFGGFGGALYCQADLAATSCYFNSNQAGDGGYPGYSGFNGGVTGQPSSSGSSGGQGGGIYGTGQLVLQGCTISGNAGGNGSPADGPHLNFIYYTRDGGPGGAGGTGGIQAENGLRMTLCTLSGNIGGSGNSGGASYDGWPYAGATGGPGGSGGTGGADCEGSNELVLVACTIAANRGGSGGTGGSGQRSYTYGGQGPGGAGGAGGVFNGNADLPGTVLDILVGSNFGGTGGAGGTAGYGGAPDLQGSFTSLGHNLVGQIDGSSGFTNGVNGDLVGSAGAPLDPLLGPLADNGGPTPTMALLHGSPALDAGDDAAGRPPYRLRDDQRGFDRKSGSRVDIGAFEFQYPDRGGGGHPSTPASILSAILSAANGKLQSDPASGSDVAVAKQFQLIFSNSVPGATFTVLATTNLALPFENWTVVGQPLQISPGLFQFSDSGSTNYPQRFYRVSSP